MAKYVNKKTLLREKSIAECRVKCKCSCVSIIPITTDYCICRWCGNKVYRTPQLKFKYEMKERLNK